MKRLKEIMEMPNLMVLETARDGGCGILMKDGKQFATVLWSDGMGWDHGQYIPVQAYIYTLVGGHVPP